MSKPVKLHTSNGVRVLVEPVTHVQSASIGVWCTTGSVHERIDEGGITHFIEHMMFKGTERRTAKEIAAEIEGRGGGLNAFTNKENTCYYARVLDEHVDVALDVLIDMVRHSKLDEVELDKERGVILEEIKRYEDEPDSHVHDLHIMARWPEHPLGKPIIGTSESVSRFQSADLKSYMDRRYGSNTIIVAVAGNVDPNKVLEAVESRMQGVEEVPEHSLPGAPIGEPGVNLNSKTTQQVHFCIGFDAPGAHDEDRFALGVMTNILGGTMSSRLFQEIREKRGLCYSIGAYTSQFSPHGGAFTIFGGTSPENWDTMQQLVSIELEKIQTDPVSDQELDEAKNNILGGLILGLESMSARMQRMARNEIRYGRFVDVEETAQQIRDVTKEQIKETAHRYLVADSKSITAIGPF